MSFLHWFDAMRVEVSMRKLFWPREPVTQDTRHKSIAALHEKKDKGALAGATSRPSTGEVTASARPPKGAIGRGGKDETDDDDGELSGKTKYESYLIGKRRKLDIAEHILKWGVMKHPQSSYLQLQLMVFKIYRYQVDKEALKENNEANQSGPSGKQAYTGVATRLEEIEKLGLTVDLQFSLFRKRKDLEHLRDALGDKESTMGSYEEVNKRQRAAVQAHERTQININNVWKALKSKRTANFNQATLTATLTALLQKVWESEQTATEAYLYIVERCSTFDMQAATLLDQYAKFLRDVKMDESAYLEMRQRAQLSTTSRDSTSHQSGSRGSEEVNSGGTGKDAASKDGQQEIRTLKARLRSATFLLMACVTILFVVYFVLASQYRDVLLNVNESGVRRVLTMRAIKLSRDMHYSAYHFKNPVSDEVAAARAVDCPRQDIRCGIAVAKRYPLCTDDQLVYHSMNPGGPTLSWPVDKICAPDLCCFEQFGPSRTEPYWSASTFTARQDLQFFHKTTFDDTAKSLDANMEDFKYFHNNLVKTFRTTFKQQEDFYDRVNDMIIVYIADPDPSLEIGRRSLKVRRLYFA